MRALYIVSGGRVDENTKVKWQHLSGLIRSVAVRNVANDLPSVERAVCLLVVVPMTHSTVCRWETVTAPANHSGTARLQ